METVLPFQLQPMYSNKSANTPMKFLSTLPPFHNYRLIPLSRIQKANGSSISRVTQSPMTSIPYSNLAVVSHYQRHERHEKNCFDLIKNLENNSNKLPIDIFESIRNRSISMLNNLPSYYSRQNHNSTRLFHFHKLTNKILKSNPHLIFTRANKGNITVALDKAEYTQSISRMLQDTDTYDIINKDQVRNLTNKTRELLTRWLKNNYITTSRYKKIYCSDGILPRAYGLPKIHKP